MLYTVLRRHLGDRMYEEGDTREARPDEVAHLVAHGVLAPMENKALGPAPETKALSRRKKAE